MSCLHYAIGEEAQIGEQFVAQMHLHAIMHLALSVCCAICYINKMKTLSRGFSRNAKIVSAGYGTFSALVSGKKIRSKVSPVVQSSGPVQ